MSGRAELEALGALLEEDELDPDSVVTGSPRTFSRAVDRLGDVEVGIWEITPGEVTDTEADELFVVLSGRARVHLPDGTHLDLGAGSLARLYAGEQTRWEVYETLRKVYVTDLGRP